jgi:hypothetical protein
MRVPRQVLPLQQPQQPQRQLQPPRLQVQAQVQVR